MSKKFGKGDPTLSIKSNSGSIEKKGQQQQSNSNWNQKRTGGYEQAAIATVTSTVTTSGTDARN